MNKAKRIVDNMDSENAFEVCSEIGIIDENATPLKQARYINELLNTTESMKIPMTDTMRKCGGCCLSTNAIKIAKKLYAKLLFSTLNYAPFFTLNGGVFA